MAKYKKVPRDFWGVCRMGELRPNTFFSLVDRNGRQGRKVYVLRKGDYNPGYGTYTCMNIDDICDFKELKPTRKVSTMVER